MARVFILQSNKTVGKFTALVEIKLEGVKTRWRTVPLIIFVQLLFNVNYSIAAHRYVAVR